MTYTITKEQINAIVSQLAEAPAKFVFNSIITLQGLPEVDTKETTK